MYIMECYSAIKKYGNMSSLTAWVEHEGIMLSGISQERQILYDFTHIWNLKNQIKQNILMDTENKLVAIKGEGTWGR